MVVVVEAVEDVVVAVVAVAVVVAAVSCPCLVLARDCLLLPDPGLCSILMTSALLAPGAVARVGTKLYRGPLLPSSSPAPALLTVTLAPPSLVSEGP